MAAILRCEQCRQEVQVESLGFFRSPAGWVQVIERQPAGDNAAHDFCGLMCAGSWAVEMVVARRAAAEAKASERTAAAGPERVQ